MPEIVADHFAGARVFDFFGKVVAHENVEKAVAVVIQEGRRIGITPAINAGFFADVDEGAVPIDEL